MSVTFTKLVSSLPESTVWCEPYPTRIVWVTMLAMADRKGRVWGSVPGLARRAGVQLAECEAALATFLGPDKHSRTPDHEGRRIAAIDGGWELLNHAKYRAMRDEEARKEYMREYMANKRLTSKQKKLTVDASKPPLAQAEAEAEAEGKEKRAEERSPVGSRLPAGWTPSASLAAWFSEKRPDLDLGETLERFRDFWTAKAGKDGRKLDWDATFRTWARNERVRRDAPAVPVRADL